MKAWRIAALLGALAGLTCARPLAPPTPTHAEVETRARSDAAQAFEAFFGVYRRTLVVAERLRRANVERCVERSGSYLGWLVFTERDFGRQEMRELASEVLNVGRSPIVVTLAPSAPAERAGVRIGDELVSIGGKRVRTSAQVGRAERGLASGRAEVVVVRAGEELTLAVEPVPACAVAALPSSAPGLETWHRGGNVFVPLALVGLADDDQLAFSIAHAMARVLEAVDPFRRLAPTPEPQTTRLAAELCTRAGFSLGDVGRLLELRGIEEPWALFAPTEDGVGLGEIPRRLAALRALGRSAEAAAR